MRTLPVAVLAALLIGVATPAATAQDLAEDEVAVEAVEAVAAATDDPDCPDCGEVADDGAVDAEDEGVEDETDEGDETPAPGSVGEALARGAVDAGTFKAPAAGKLRVELRSTSGEVLGRLSLRPKGRGAVALRVRLNATGTATLEAAEGPVALAVTTRFVRSSKGKRAAVTATRSLQLGA